MWRTARGARSAITAATSVKGWMVPTSLLASITDTNAVRSSRAPARASRSTTPPASTGTIPTRKPSRSRRSTLWRTAWCSTAVVTTPSPRPRWRAEWAAPFTARLSASVPPPVKMISPGRTPSAAATVSRASSMAVLAARAAACWPEGFPKMPDRKGSIASSASGRMGVVAAWSR